MDNKTKINDALDLIDSVYENLGGGGWNEMVALRLKKSHEFLHELLDFWDLDNPRLKKPQGEQ